MDAKQILTDEEMLDEARRRVALGRGLAASNGIINGAWDRGELVQSALAEVRAEQASGAR